MGTDRYAGERYVEVAPAGSPVAPSPYTNYDREPGKATIGEHSRMVLRVTDDRQAHRELTTRGVRFETEPFDLPHGTFAAIRDAQHETRAPAVRAVRGVVRGHVVTGCQRLLVAR